MLWQHFFGEDAAETCSNKCNNNRALHVASSAVFNSSSTGIHALYPTTRSVCSTLSSTGVNGAVHSRAALFMAVLTYCFFCSQCAKKLLRIKPVMSHKKLVTFINIMLALHEKQTFDYRIFL